MRVALTGLFLITFLPACEDGSTTGGETTTGGQTTTETPYPTEESFCDALAEAECNSLVVKGCYGSDDASLAEDTAACKAARVASCNLEELEYHPEAAEACLAARESALADGAWDYPELEDIYEKCLPVLSGDLPAGSECVKDADCAVAEGLRCIVKLGEIQGVCAVPIVGDSCDEEGEVCDEASFCVGGSFCADRQAEGMACSSTAECVAGTYCSDEGGCAARLADGSKCTSAASCAGGFCVGQFSNEGGVCASTEPLTIDSPACDQLFQ